MNTYNVGSSGSGAICFQRHGSIDQPETDTSGNTPIHVYYTDIPNEFQLQENENEMLWTNIFSLDMDQDKAESDFDMGIQSIVTNSTEDFLVNHTDAWKEIWDRGRIEIDGFLHLQKVLYGSFYYIYSNLPASLPNNEPNQFYGLSPGGLPNGRNGSDYYGHVFWDMETWMYPAILMFRPDLAEQMLDYRIHAMDPAFHRAADGGCNGTRFPWESAYTGVEVTPDVCVECRENQQHITGDIAFAARQYISATRDIAWLQRQHPTSGYTGLNFIHEMARFWYTRPTYNATKDRYEILGKQLPHIK